MDIQNATQKKKKLADQELNVRQGMDVKSAIKAKPPIYSPSAQVTEDTKLKAQQRFDKVKNSPPGRFVQGYMAEYTPEDSDVTMNAFEAGQAAANTPGIGMGDDVLRGAMMMPAVAGGLSTKGGKAVGEAIQQLPKAFEGFQDLTTGFLSKLKGMKQVDPQTISNLTKSQGVKQAEIDIVNKVLEKYRGGGKTNLVIKDLLDAEGDNIETLISKLPPSEKSLTSGAIDVVDSGEGHMILDGQHRVGEAYLSGKKNIEANILSPKEALSKYGDRWPHLENVLPQSTGNSKIPVSQFAEDIKGELLPLSTKKLTNKYVDEFDNVQYESVNLPDELRGNVANYQENIYESPIKTSAGNVHFGNKSPNYFAHTRVEDLDDNTTRRVIEAQSDLFQKDGLQRELDRNRDDWIDVKNWVDEQGYKRGTHDIRPERKAELSPLKPYENTWHERVIREEVKKAAQDGKTKLQFPTGETAMKIEGLGDGGVRWYADDGARELTPDTLKAGESISDMNFEWVVTDVLGDGKFRALQKKWANALSDPTLSETKKNLLRERSEQFDISGKVDSNNPIYKFYESEVGKYLGKKYGAKRIVDPQGVQWWEVDVSPEQGKAPIEAFGVAPLAIGSATLQDERKKEKQPIYSPSSW